MQKYNRDKRGTYNARTRKIKIYDACDTRSNIQRVKIHIRYDKYNKNNYIADIYRKTRDIHAQRYVKITNIITDIFPEINTPHTKHIHRAIAPYRKYPRTDDTPYTRALKWHEQVIEDSMKEQTIHRDTRTVKCIILNDDEEIIYIGMMRRTRTVNVTRGTIDITLHRNKRTMQAYERAIDPDRIIHSITVREIKAHDVEIYYI